MSVKQSTAPTKAAAQCAGLASLSKKIAEENNLLDEHELAMGNKLIGEAEDNEPEGGDAN